MTNDSEGQRIESDSAVTTIIRQHPLPDAIGRYEAWLKEIIPVAQTFTGHRGVNIIRPHTPAEAYTIVLHFDSVANLRNWLDSETRMRLADKIRPDLRVPEAIDIKTGFEFWFTPPPAGKAAKPYKQYLVTLSAIYPLTILVPSALQPLFAQVPALALPGIRQLLSAAIIVALMVYVIMPRYTRALSRWLWR